MQTKIIRSRYLILTILVQYALIRLLDKNYISMIIMLMVCLLIGLAIRYADKKEVGKFENFGWGLLYGTISTIVIIIIFVGFAMYAFG